MSVWKEPVAVTGFKNLRVPVCALTVPEFSNGTSMT